MIHWPCGKQNLNSPCMAKNVEQCTKKFPKHFIDNNIIKSGYPLYRRRNDGRTIHFTKNKWANNINLASHINLEVCSTVLCVKLLCDKILFFFIFILY